MSASHVLATPMLVRPPFAPKPSRQRQFNRPAEPRRPSPTQGRALEILNHAIEYLVDSRLDETWNTPTDAEAVHILMACSRAVFMDCEVILSWPQRLQRAALRRLHPAHNASR